MTQWVEGSVFLVLRSVKHPKRVLSEGSLPSWTLVLYTIREWLLLPFPSCNRGIPRTIFIWVLKSPRNRYTFRIRNPIPFFHYNRNWSPVWFPKLPLGHHSFCGVPGGGRGWRHDTGPDGDAKESFLFMRVHLKNFTLLSDKDVRNRKRTEKGR